MQSGRRLQRPLHHGFNTLKDYLTRRVQSSCIGTSCRSVDATSIGRVTMDILGRGGCITRIPSMGHEAVACTLFSVRTKLSIKALRLVWHPELPPIRFGVSGSTP